ncbi:probable WRKY transcription factor 13 [Benincasa hispida]|uniref:probable WRKY transcription factor 13 n=1 Tax=Benincasa hispida TaxID=102211 RepID=UPI0019022A8B|nr:probable WRKY transcription factor 13 [Benincasa hispida]
MGSSASEAQEIMVSLLQADQVAAAANAAAISTNFISWPENNNVNNINFVQQSLKPFFFSTHQYSSHQHQQQSLFPFCPSTTTPSYLLSSQNTPSPSSLWDEMESFMRGRNGIGNYGGDGDDNDDRKPQLRISTLKMKRIKGRKKVREPRFSFKTMTDVDVLDDGYKWRKYGQKIVKNTLHPRSYYRCTEENCKVKKRVERLADDPRMVITTYEGRHAHSPSDHNVEDSIMCHLPSSHLTNFFC